jgi:hypothetical protein
MKYSKLYYIEITWIDRFGEKKLDILKFNKKEESKNGSLIGLLT